MNDKTPTPKAHIDFETASCADLRKTGVWRYAEDPTTLVLCMAWAIGDDPVQIWKPGDKFPIKLLDHVRDGGEIHAWNAHFEIAIWQMMERRGKFPVLSLAQVRCTMAAAAYWGLPLSLDMAAIAIGSSQLKDKTGAALMKRMMRPRKVDLKAGKLHWWHEEDQDKYNQLMDYCLQDVRTEREISLKIPPLPLRELAVWRCDLKMNMHGVPLDLEAIRRLKVLAEQEKKRLDADMAKATLGNVTAAAQNAKLMEWVNIRQLSVATGPQAGWELVKSLAKEPLADLLTRTDLLPEVRRALEIRQEAGKTSTAKLNSMEAAVCSDGRVRGLVQYYGANRTGRWSGRLVQIQNLPRPVLDFPEKFIENLLRQVSEDHFILSAVFDTALNCVSSAIRGCFKSEQDFLFQQNDLSQIEARVVAWLAGQDDILKVFKAGEDVYVYTAKKQGSDNRQFGKVLVLACGFGMGGPKFQETAKTYGLMLGDQEAADAVSDWRQANPMIKKYWKRTEQAVIQAILHPGIAQGFGTSGRSCMARVETEGLMKGHLLITLPSGRQLVYRDPELRQGKYGPEITYMGVNQYTRKWERVSTYGGKLVENITQAVARDVIAEATVNVERELSGLCMTVHDELVRHGPANTAASDHKKMQEIMNRVPVWAKGLPIASDGWIGERYRK